MAKAEVRLDHKTGPVVIAIEAETPEVASYMANRIKEIFGAKKSSQSAFHDIFKDMGLFK